MIKSRKWWIHSKQQVEFAKSSFWGKKLIFRSFIIFSKRFWNFDTIKTMVFVAFPRPWLWKLNPKGAVIRHTKHKERNLKYISYIINKDKAIRRLTSSWSSSSEMSSSSITNASSISTGEISNSSSYKKIQKVVWKTVKIINIWYVLCGCSIDYLQIIIWSGTLKTLVFLRKV